MRQHDGDRELPAMNHHQIFHEMQNHAQNQMLPSSNFEPLSSHDDFLEQMLSSVPPSAAYPWADDHPPPGMAEDQPSKMRQQQISSGAAKALMLQQQLLLARTLAAGNGQMLRPDHSDGVDAASSFDSANLANDASVKALFNGFTGSLGQTSNQSQHFHHQQGGGLQQSPSFGATAAAPSMSQPVASGSSGGATAGQPKQRVRARRGQATDPHSIAERLRRERIAERMKSLQELVPNANKTDKASMLDEIIDYVKFLQLQVKVLSMSRLGGAGAVAPLIADKSPQGQGRSGNGTQTASSSNNNNNNNKKEGMTVTEQQVAKLMEEDMGSAMQYLQGKGLCLMPISLATAISTATRNPSNNPLLNGGGDGGGGPLSPTLSALTVQSATRGGGGDHVSVKDAATASQQE